MQYLSILGRETELCLAEIASKADVQGVIGHEAALFTADSRLDIDKLGGSIKLCEVFETLPAKYSEAELGLRISSEILATAPMTGKINYGISVYGTGTSKLRDHGMRQLGLTIKKILRAEGRGGRYVAPKSGVALSAAQLKYNQLTSSGIEIILAFSQNEVILAHTYDVQDIDSYSKRDWERPVRDSKVGMLPPKLAQIMVNLVQPQTDQTIFDPFCGNGVVLQEALLAGHPAVGSDLEPKMVEATEKNLSWLKQNYSIANGYKVTQEDATKLTSLPDNSVVVTEGFLGKPINSILRSKNAPGFTADIDQLYQKFLKNLQLLLPVGARLVLSFPIWRSEHGLVSLPIVDQIEKMGYTFEQCSGRNTLVYLRDNQFVGREIAVLARQ